MRGKKSKKNGKADSKIEKDQLMKPKKTKSSIQKKKKATDKQTPPIKTEIVKTDNQKVKQPNILSMFQNQPKTGIKSP